MASASHTDDIKAEIASNKVMVYSKSYCPFCVQTKNLLQEQGIAYQVKELDQIADGQKIQDALLQMTKQRTVPNIFINGEHLGGNSDLVKAKDDGSLAAKTAA